MKKHTKIYMITAFVSILLLAGCEKESKNNQWQTFTYYPQINAYFQVSEDSIFFKDSTDIIGDIIYAYGNPDPNIISINFSAITYYLTDSLDQPFHFISEGFLEVANTATSERSILTTFDHLSINDNVGPLPLDYEDMGVMLLVDYLTTSDNRATLFLTGESNKGPLNFTITFFITLKVERYM